MTKTSDDVITSVPTDPAPRGRARRTRWRPLVGILAGCLVAGALGVVLLGGSATSGPEVAPGIDQASARVLALGVLSGSGSAAPDFSLTDQHGRGVSLSAFRGDAVVLSFNDDRCRDLCTLFAQSVLVADRDLGPSSHVVFLSVNVNPFFPHVGSVRAWTEEHGLGTVANWHFGTTSAPALERIWRAYGVEVQRDATTRTVTHGAQLFFIDPRGRMRAVGDFGVSAANTRYFAHTMAQMATDLLPAASRHQVGGPGTPPPAQGNVSPGSPAPSFRLPALGTGGHVALATLTGRPAVITFWSPTCVPCRAELSALETAHRDLGATVNFLGIDVGGDVAAARSLARHDGVTFALADDGGGAAAAAYQVTGTPYSVIVSPTGVIEIVHPATFTTEQVEYLLRSLYPSVARGS